MSRHAATCRCLSTISDLLWTYLSVPSGQFSAAVSGLQQKFTTGNAWLCGKWLLLDKKSMWMLWCPCNQTEISKKNSNAVVVWRLLLSDEINSEKILPTIAHGKALIISNKEVAQKRAPERRFSENFGVLTVAAYKKVRNYKKFYILDFSGIKRIVQSRSPLVFILPGDVSYGPGLNNLGTFFMGPFEFHILWAAAAGVKELGNGRFRPCYGLQKPVLQ